MRFVPKHLPYIDDVANLAHIEHVTTLWRYIYGCEIPPFVYASDCDNFIQYLRNRRYFMRYFPEQSQSHWLYSLADGSIWSGDHGLIRAEHIHVWFPHGYPITATPATRLTFDAAAPTLKVIALPGGTRLVNAAFVDRETGFPVMMAHIRDQMGGKLDFPAIAAIFGREAVIWLTGFLAAMKLERAGHHARPAGGTATRIA